MPRRENEEEGKWRLLNPLCIRYSQPRIAPHFRDGHLLEETLAEVTEAPLECEPQPTDEPLDEAASGPPPFDLVLIPPFPAIRVIRWRPKIRSKDGEAKRDENGDQILGRLAWFALDNRRVHVMQLAAARLWPRRCAMAVRCIEEVPGSTVRELRKFRTTTEGRSVEVGVRAGDTRSFRWAQAVPRGSVIGSRDTDAFFAVDMQQSQDLWSAEQWAPAALAAATVQDEEEEPAPRNVHSSTGEAKRAPTHEAKKAPAHEVKKPYEQERREAMITPQQCQPVARPQTQAYEPTRVGVATICPETGWQYIDPTGKIQGPFVLEKMRLWYIHGFFRAELPMRCSATDVFVTFAELFPKPVEPFTGTVMRYFIE